MPENQHKYDLESVDLILRRCQNHLEKNNVVICWKTIKEARNYIVLCLKELLRKGGIDG